MIRTWRVRAPGGQAASSLAAATGLPQTVTSLLVNRGVLSADDVRAFLAPKLSELQDPRGLRGMAEATTLVLDALEQDDPIVIYGDYDVDGMTAASVLFRFFRSVGVTPRVFLPDRFRDGYGLNPDRLGELIDEGAKLVITVDCGISAVEPIRMARERGVDVIIVDHHRLPRGELPPASATINPHHPECSFPFKDLCAAGLAFHLAVALRSAMRSRGDFLESAEPDVRDLLDLVAIGTIADVVPLRGLNRMLVHAGLPRIERAKSPGVRALRTVSLKQSAVTGGGVAFHMAPRLNAAGRLSSPMKGFEILTTLDATVAQAIAAELNEENGARKAIQESIEAEAISQALREQGEDAPAYVLWDAGWHTGVAGIVAARIVERFHRPAAVIALVDGVGKGSLRSISGFDVLAGLERCSDLLIQYGGHAHAAGVTIDPAQLPAFRAAFAAAARELTPEASLTPSINIDAVLGFAEITSEFIEQLTALAPFGAGNPEPVFASHDVRVVERRQAGKTGEHFRLVLQEGGLTLPAIAFRIGERCPLPGDLVDVAYRARFNDFDQRPTLQLEIIDLKPSEPRSEAST